MSSNILRIVDIEVIRKYSENSTLLIRRKGPVMKMQQKSDGKPIETAKFLSLKIAFCGGNIINKKITGLGVVRQERKMREFKYFRRQRA